MVKTKKVLKEELVEKMFKFTSLKVQINNAESYKESIDCDIRQLLKELGINSYQNNYGRVWINNNDVLEVF